MPPHSAQEHGGEGHVYPTQNGIPPHYCQPQNGIPPHRYPPREFDSRVDSMPTRPNGGSVTPGGATRNDLLSFLQNNESCLKDTSANFYKFLIGEDISSLADLSDACDDGEYLPKLKNAGIKGFKTGPFIKAVKLAIGRNV